MTQHINLPGGGKDKLPEPPEAVAKTLKKLGCLIGVSALVGVAIVEVLWLCFMG